MPKSSPYENVARLPEGDRVDLRTLVAGAWFELEIGPGPKAGFLLERADAAPEAALVGLEIRRKWAFVGDERLAKRGHAKRARVFCEDARFALPRLHPDASVKRVFLHFPDPWWKKRHQKRLVVGDVVLDQIARLLEDGGELFVQTDVEERATLYGDVIAAHASFESVPIHENPYGARSPREHRAIADGLPVHRMLFKRRARGR
jgi:tRNA (guanine-N7-)-methyltransferase